MANSFLDAANRITAILKDETGTTSRDLLQTSVEFCINLQMIYDLRNPREGTAGEVRKSIDVEKYWPAR